MQKGVSAVDDVEVYAYVLAETLGDEPNEQVAIPNEEGGIDYLDNLVVLKEGDTVMVRGDSYITGDRVTYLLPWDREVGLWMV